jgi:hypothetical protein
MNIFKPCKYARPTRAYRCERERGTCVNCGDFVPDTVEREPTGHAWITYTNKYFKRTQTGMYEKGIITGGSTYVFCVSNSPGCKHWELSVWVNGQPVVLGAQVQKIGVAIHAGAAIVRHLIASDINRDPDRGI